MLKLLLSLVIYVVVSFYSTYFLHRQLRRKAIYYIQENVMNISLGAKLFSIHSLTLQAVLNLYPILCAIRYLDTVTMDFGGVTLVL